MKTSPPKRAAVEAALRAAPDRPNADIAREAGCSRALVAIVRTELIRAGLPADRRRLNAPKTQAIAAAVRADPRRPLAHIARELGCSSGLVSTVASRVLRGALALLLLLALGAPPARAQGQAGIWRDLRPRPAASWWAWPGCTEAPALVVEGGEGGSSCERGIAIVWAQGDYRLVVADGVVLFREWRVYLPEVATTTTRPEGP